MRRTYVSPLRLWAVIAVVVATVAFGIGGTVSAADDASDLAKRIAALEASQKAILKELQEIKALLQNRPTAPMPVPTPAAMPSAPSVAPPAQNPSALPTFDLEIAGSPAKGRADAKLVVVEFSDFQCPFCGRFSRDTFPQIDREYIETGKVRYVFRNFPLERLHPLALKAAEAAECANAEGKFWDMHSRLFANQEALADADLLKAGQAVGLKMPTFQSCVAAPAVPLVKIRQDQADGARAGITGTPAFFIGKMTRDGKVHALKKLIGAQPYAAFKTALDAVLTSVDASK
jgi:protein-disulfide isomerase